MFLQQRWAFDGYNFMIVYYFDYSGLLWPSEGPPGETHTRELLCLFLNAHII